MRLICGSAFDFLDEIKPRFIVTDANPEDWHRLLRWSEHNDAIIIDGYSTRWLTRAHPHPAQKFTWPYRRIIECFPDEPVVCDPFMGSGSIGEAAILAGRDFIGIERMKEFFDYAERRLLDIPVPETRQARAL